MINERPELTINGTPIQMYPVPVEGGYVEMLGESYYRIGNYDQMPPFFMSLVSSADHWLFVSSTGGLTAGRINSNSALFPYETEDKITAHSEITGSKTIVCVTRERPHRSLGTFPTATPVSITANITCTKTSAVTNLSSKKLTMICSSPCVPLGVLATGLGLSAAAGCKTMGARTARLIYSMVYKICCLMAQPMLYKPLSAVCSMLTSAMN